MPVLRTHSLLSSLTDEVRQHFRAEMSVPVQLITADGDELHCISNNLGTSGMGLKGLTTLLVYRSRLRVRFQFPEADQPIEAMATLAWADRHGCAGVVFTDNPPSIQREISEWLHRRLMEENWNSPTLPAIAIETRFQLCHFP